MSSVEFQDFSVEVIGAIDSIAESVLLEVGGEIEAETKRNTRQSTGGGSKTKNSWQHFVEKTSDGYMATVGSPEQNAIWEEFGTGEYALGGNGRKGYWVFVKDGEKPDDGDTRVGKSYTLKEAKKVMRFLREKGLEAYYTNGKPPSRALFKAYTRLKDKMIKYIQSKFTGGLS